MSSAAPGYQALYENALLEKEAALVEAEQTRQLAVSVRATSLFLS
jgi:hypothetical protein